MQAMLPYQLKDLDEAHKPTAIAPVALMVVFSDGLSGCEEVSLG